VKAGFHQTLGAKANSPCCWIGKSCSDVGVLFGVVSVEEMFGFFFTEAESVQGLQTCSVVI